MHAASVTRERPARKFSQPADSLEMDRRAPARILAAMWQLMLVSLGGAIGSGARYLVSDFAARRLPAGYPWGTFAVNVAGSFLLGAVVSAALAGRVSPEWRLFLATGVLGGFTTYSSFNSELLKAMQEGAPAFGIAYAAAMLAGGLAAGLAGLAAGRWAFA